MPFDRFAPILLLLASNVFMTFAWYGHLKYRSVPLMMAILASWGIALFEYTLMVPANRIGSTVYSGFEAAAYESLLDSAGYPRAGILPARNQGDPGMPEGYVPPAERQPKAEPAKPEAAAPKPAAPTGPYAPR